MIYAATYAINQVREFRYRIVGDKVILFDSIHPAFLDMMRCRITWMHFNPMIPGISTISNPFRRQTNLQPHGREAWVEGEIDQGAVFISP